MDADTKFVPSWYVGRRDTNAAITFMKDLNSRLANRVQLTTDGFRPYLVAVENAFGSDIDYAQCVKIYSTPGGGEIRYSGGECCGMETKRVMGNPDPKHMNTAYIERQNLTMRMCMRRFTRLTNAHSKKVENLIYSIAIHYMYYNFVRINQAIRCTPAMKVGITDHLWEISDLVDLINK